jgi:U4/U6 small nuclear ribonucleoprotein PRP3
VRCSFSISASGQRRLQAGRTAVQTRKSPVPTAMDRHNHQNGLGPRHDPTSRIHKNEAAADRMAALKARVAAAIGGSKAKGGLNVGLHPALEDLGQWRAANKQQDARNMTSSRSTAEPSRQVTSTKRPGAATLASSQNNPYYDESASNQGGPSSQRKSRQLIFNQKGKYIQQANALRKQAALEALKKRIAEQSRKAGIDEDLDVEKNFVVEAPPDIEWFDEGLVNGKNYDNVEESRFLKLTTADTVITAFVQHPVPLEPPQDKNLPAPKPLPLTSKEAAKLRRQRRGAELKETQAKIRLGLVPTPPPKVKNLASMMRVLGSDAVNDPTSVELRVKREIAERHQQHMQTNEDRKLTKDQKHEKLAANQEKDAAKGLHMLVFKIGSLVNGAHRYKIGVTAEQLALTGVCIMHSKFNLVVAEGGEWSINKYRKLLVNRIDWTENAPSRDRDGKQASTRAWLLAEDDKGALKDLGGNYCTLLFEGEVKNRAFRKFYSRIAETEPEAREILSRVKLEAFWGQAKNSTP